MPNHIESVFRSPLEAERAAQELRLAGFGHDQIEIHHSQQGVLDALVPADEREQPTRVTVEPDGRYLEAAAILHRHGGADIGRGPKVEHRATPGGERLELVEEHLVPRVTAIAVGEVAVRKKIVREKRTVEVEVLREEIVVERLPASQHDELGEADAGGHVLGADEEVTSIPLYEEQVIIEKRPVLREHAVIHKRRVPQVERFTDTVRREVPVVTSSGKTRVSDRTKARAGT